MAVDNTQIKFYHSLALDGGDIDTNKEILTDVLNSFIGDVSASNSESGVVKRKKFYVKNTNTADIAYVTHLGLSSFSIGDDYFTVYPSTGNATVEGDETFTRRYGVALCTGEFNGFDIPVTFEEPSIYTDIFKVGDKVTFFDSTTRAKIVTTTIAAITSTQLTVNDDLTALTLDSSYVASVIDTGDIAASGYTGFWLEQTVKPFSAEQMSNTMNVTFYFDPIA